MKFNQIHYSIKAGLVIALFFVMLSIGASRDCSNKGTFPSEPFNGMQIDYGISGACITKSQDGKSSEPRELKGTLDSSGTLRVRGTARMKWGYYADLVVNVWAGDKANPPYSARIPTGNEQTFDVAVPIPPGATSGRFSIEMTGKYNAETRDLTVHGNLLNNRGQNQPQPGEIKYEGTGYGKEIVEKALDLLKRKDPAGFNNVTRNIKIISFAEAGMQTDSTTEKVTIQISRISSNHIKMKPWFEDADINLKWLAAGLVHEAKHIQIIHDYMAAHNGQRPTDDLISGPTAEAKCCTDQFKALKNMEAPVDLQEWVNPANKKGVMATKWWERTPEQLTKGS